MLIPSTVHAGKQKRKNISVKVATENSNLANWTYIIQHYVHGVRATGYTVKPVVQDIRKSGHLYKQDIKLWSQILINV